MTEETKNTQTTPQTAAPEKDAARTTAPARGRGGKRSDAAPERGQRRGARASRGERRDRTPEFAQKILDIRRVTRVMAGGRRFSFSVTMVIGDKKGRVGVGVGKASDTALAIEKSIRDARKRMITVARTENNSIPHDVEAKYGSSAIIIRPAQGRGLVAGAAVRTVLELAGVTDVTSKVLSRSKNQMNIARAAIAALTKLQK